MLPENRHGDSSSRGSQSVPTTPAATPANRSCFRGCVQPSGCNCHQPLAPTEERCSARQARKPSTRSLLRAAAYVERGRCECRRPVALAVLRKCLARQSRCSQTIAPAVLQQMSWDAGATAVGRSLLQCCSRHRRKQAPTLTARRTCCRKVPREAGAKAVSGRSCCTRCLWRQSREVVNRSTSLRVNRSANIPVTRSRLCPPCWSVLDGLESLRAS
jgi:hypothetical protein